jgi:RimJ/RimL family protein N-acetyltransferase
MRPNLTRLEPLDIVHAEGLFAALDDERVGRHIGGPDVTTAEDLRDRIRRLKEGAPAGSGMEWLNHAVLHSEVVVGRVEATLHSGVAEIAYVFGPRWWGQGLATDAVRQLVVMLEPRCPHGAWAAVAPGNTASQRLLMRLGFAVTDVPAGLRLLSYEPGDLVFALVPAQHRLIVPTSGR